MPENSENIIEQNQEMENMETEQKGVGSKYSTPLLNSGGLSASSKEETKGSFKETIRKIKKYKALFPIGCGALGCAGILFIAAIIAAVFIYIGDLFKIESTLGKIPAMLTDFADNVANAFSGCWFIGEEECIEKNRDKFFNEVENVYKEYQNEHQLNLDSALLVSTLTYRDVLDEDSALSASDYRRMKKMLDQLADHMAPWKEEEIEKEITNEKGEKEIVIEVIRRRKLDLVEYETYLREEFIPDYYYRGQNKGEISSKIDRTIEEIYLRVDFYKYIVSDGISGGKYTKVYGFCPGITVTDDLGNVIGVYDLDTYIAGVLSGEVHSGQGEEFYKAQAIAARTFVLNYTNNCQRSIVSGESAQVFNPNIQEYGRKAADDTSGLVLIYNDSIFSAQYDSFCYGDSRCPDSHYNEFTQNYEVTYTRVPDGTQHTLTLPSSYSNLFTGRGHAHGMSQLVGYEMAKQGYNYEEILEYFYSDGVKISQMVNTIVGNFSSSSTMVASAEEIRTRADFYAELGQATIGNNIIDLSRIYNKRAGNLGQCVWYARSRALELIFYSNMSDEDKVRAYEIIASTTGHGGQWFDNAPLDNFEKSTDHTKPRVGAIVSWTSSMARGASHNYGHVAIIESVDEVNQTVVISEGWNKSGPDAPNIWSNVGYQTRTLTFEQVRTNNGRPGYTFNGYVYILG